MEQNSIVQWLPAVTGLGGVIVGSLISWVVQARLLGRRIQADETLTLRKFEFDKELAERKFDFDQEFHDHKRRVELAETILSDFLQMADVSQAVRSPLAFGGEGDGRTLHEGETEEQARQRDSYYVPLARLIKHSEFVSGLMSKRYRSRAVLGAQIDQAFQEIRDIIISIQTSSNTLMRMVGVPEQVWDRNEKLISRCEANIWEGLPEDDQLKAQTTRSIEVVENVCRPILERVRPQ